MGMALAYLRDPKWKAFILVLPIPFTLATLSLREPVDTTHVMGLCLLLGYTHGVRILHQRLATPIFQAILLSALSYCSVALVLVRVVPCTNLTFWLISVATFGLGLLLYLTTPNYDEPRYRSPLPVWLKLPITAMVVFTLIIMKKYLHGFMALFPMVGVMSSYESRHSLWTVCRQIHGFVVAFMALLVVCRVFQARLGLEVSLAIAWVVYGVIVFFLTRSMWAKKYKISASMETSSEGVQL